MKKWPWLRIKFFSKHFPIFQINLRSSKEGLIFYFIIQMSKLRPGQYNDFARRSQSVFQSCIWTSIFWLQIQSSLRHSSRIAVRRREKRTDLQTRLVQILSWNHVSWESKKMRDTLPEMCIHVPNTVEDNRWFRSEIWHISTLPSSVEL